MAPTNIDLAQTKRWLAQLHTTDLPSASPLPVAVSALSCSSSSSTRSGNSLDDGSSSSSSTSPTSPLGGIDTRHTSVSSTTSVPPPSPLTATQARSLQRLCEISDTNNSINNTAANRDINAGMSPNNINYIKHSTAAGWASNKGGVPWSPNAASPTVSRQRRWSRRQSGQSLAEVEGESMRRFSLSKFLHGRDFFSKEKNPPNV